MRNAKPTARHHPHRQAGFTDAAWRVACVQGRQHRHLFDDEQSSLKVCRWCGLVVTADMAAALAAGGKA